MRLIDGDKLLEQFKTLRDNWDTRNATHRAIRGAFVDCILRTRDAPTVDAEPVKHGNWCVKQPCRMKLIPEEGDGISEEETIIEDMTEQKCSVCQRWAIKFTHHIEMNYCPNCGARLRTPYAEDLK